MKYYLHKLMIVYLLFFAAMLMTVYLLGCKTTPPIDYSNQWANHVIPVDTNGLQ